MKKGKRKTGFNIETITITVIVLIFLSVMSIQVYKLKQKDELYAQREQNLKEQIEQETKREEELVELDLYTKSVEYIKDMANKMGLVFEDEIIFKESGE